MDFTVAWVAGLGIKLNLRKSSSVDDNVVKAIKKWLNPPFGELQDKGSGVVLQQWMMEVPISSRLGQW